MTELTAWAHYIGCDAEYICGRRWAYRIPNNVGNQTSYLGIQYATVEDMRSALGEYPSLDREQWDLEEMAHPDSRFGGCYQVKDFPTWDEAVEWARRSP
jgi:hypothetical protein